MLSVFLSFWLKLRVILEVVVLSFHILDLLIRFSNVFSDSSPV